MGEHYPRATISVSAWCVKCTKHTEHRVDNGRLGPCLRCIERLQEQSARLDIERQRARRQGSLWGDVI